MNETPEFTLHHWLLHYAGRVGAFLVIPLAIALDLWPTQRWLLFGGTIVIYIGLVFFCAWRRRRERINERVIVKAYPSWSEKEARQRYSIESFLKSAQTDGVRIGIVARTCFRWFCGSEEDYAKHRDQFMLEQARLQEAIIDAFSKNKEFFLSVVLQCPRVNMPWWKTDSKEVRLNEKHFGAAVRSIQEIKARLNHDGRRFMLAFTDKAISNSMTRLTRPRTPTPTGQVRDDRKNEREVSRKSQRVALLIVELSDPFFLAPEFASGARLRKPFAVFETAKGHIEEYLIATEEFCRSSADCTSCDKEDCPAKEVNPATEAELRHAMGL